MTFLVGELAAEIRLQGKEQYARDLQSAGRQTEQLANKTSRTASVMKSGFTGAAVAITGATVAGAAFGVSLFKQGAAYNTLQQTSRAALKTVLGGATAANAQMDKLDAFARTSPFSKGVFISAQQQLLAFGMEAKKVIPTLDAVQQAIAASGGSSQQLSEVTFVLAQIQAAGKITATDLMQLGQRGIDAATIIGSQLGKTGAEVRQDITKSRITSEQALDALTAGMQKKFGGASANVKNTIVGAADRIKAATREIGASLAEPFISQKGAGLAVLWGNQVADVLQAVRGQTQPVVSIFERQLTPAFANITKGLDRAAVSVKAWDSDRLETFLQHAKGYTPGIAALSGGILALTSGALRGIPIVGALIPKLNPLVAAVTAVAATSPELRAAGADMLTALQPLIPVVGDVAKTIAGTLNVAIPPAAAAIRTIADVAKPVVGVIGAIPAPVIAASAAFIGMRKAADGLGKPLQAMFDGMKVQAALAGMGTAAQSSATGIGAAAKAAEGTTRSVAAMPGVLGLAGKAATGLGLSLKTAFMSNPVGLVILGVSTAVGLLTTAFTAQGQHAAEVRDRIAAYKDTLDQTTGAVTAATRATVEKNLADSTAFADAEKLGVSKETLLRATLGEADAQKVLNAALKEHESLTPKQATRNGSAGAAEESAARDLNRAYQEQADAINKAAEETARYKQEQKDAADAMGEAGRSNARLNDALAIARDTTRDATERINALDQALDELNGGTKSQADQTRDLNEQALRLKEAFAQTGENGKKLAKGLVSATGEIDTSTDAGLRLYDSIKQLNGKMKESVLASGKDARERGDWAAATKEATAAAEPYIKKLQKIATDAGLSKGQVAGLTATMLDNPSLISFMITDNGTIDEAMYSALKLAQQIMKTPNGKVEMDKSAIATTRAQLTAMGFKIKDLPEGRVRVTANGVGTVEQILRNLTRDRDARVTVTTVRNTINRVTGTTAVGSGTVLKPGLDTGGVFSRGVQQFAMGGLPSGIYRGRHAGIHKFAEGNLPWEAYISPHPMYRERNKTIAKEAVSRLGGKAYFDSPGTAAFAAGGISLYGSNLTVAKAEKEARAAERAYQKAAKKERDRARAVADAEKRVQQKTDAASRAGRRSKKSAQRDALLARRKLASLKKAESSSKQAITKAASARKDKNSKLADARGDVKDKRSDFRSDLTDWNTGNRRGENKAAGMNGNGLTLVDKLFDLGSGLGGKTGKRLTDQARKQESAYLRLEKSAEKAATSLDKAKDKLSSVKDAAASMASSVTSAVRGFFQVGSLAETTSKTQTSTRKVDGVTITTASGTTTAKPTAGGIASSVKGTASRIRRFAEKLKSLKAKGLAPALLNEVAGLGVEAGEPLADALMTATKTEMASINQGYSDIGKYSAQAGSTVADANFSKQIKIAEAAMKLAEKSSAQIQAELKKQTDRIIKTLTDSLTWGSGIKKKAAGGPILGPGTGLADAAGLYALGNNEHVVTEREVAGAGGHAAVQRIRQAMLEKRIDVRGLRAGMRPGNAAAALAGPGRGGTGLQVSIINPIVRDIDKDAWEAAQLIAGSVGR